MEEQWRLYLKEHAPELYAQAIESVAWECQWRNNEIKRLKRTLENYRKFILFRMVRKSDT